MKAVAIIVPLVAAIIGLVIYLLAEKQKPSEIGRQLMFCGFFWTLAVLAWKEIQF